MIFGAISNGISCPIPWIFKNFVLGIDLAVSSPPSIGMRGSASPCIIKDGIFTPLSSSLRLPEAIIAAS